MAHGHIPRKAPIATLLALDYGTYETNTARGRGGLESFRELE